MESSIVVLCECQASIYTKFEMESTAFTWVAIQRLKDWSFYHPTLITWTNDRIDRLEKFLSNRWTEVRIDRL